MEKEATDTTINDGGNSTEVTVQKVETSEVKVETKSEPKAESSTSESTNNNNSGSVPYPRFHEVNEKKKALESELNSLKEKYESDLAKAKDNYELDLGKLKADIDAITEETEKEKGKLMSDLEKTTVDKENIVNELSKQVAELLEAKEKSEKEASKRAYEQRVASIARNNATGSEFEDTEYLSSLFERDGIDVNDENKVSDYMNNMFKNKPKFFKADIKSGLGVQTPTQGIKPVKSVSDMTIQEKKEWIAQNGSFDDALVALAAEAKKNNPFRK